MTEWTRTKPTKPGEYWLCEDHWTDSTMRFVRVFQDLDGDLSCVFVGFTDSLKLGAVAHPSYWLPVQKPGPPVFGRKAYAS